MTRMNTEDDFSPEEDEGDVLFGGGGIKMKSDENAF